MNFSVRNTDFRYLMKEINFTRTGKMDGWMDEQTDRQMYR